MQAAVPRNGYLRAEEPEDHVVRLRTYNLHITYDKYYSVPKFWLIGRDESGQPLQTIQVSWTCVTIMPCCEDVVHVLRMSLFCLTHDNMLYTCSEMPLACRF